MFTSPWFMLAILFVARTSTGFVFQSIGSSGPAIAAALVIDFALIGTLIGLFKIPGIFLSLPSSMLGKLTSDRLLIAAGLGVMAVGCGITAFADDFALAATGRLITGIGATVTNLFFTKVTLDWFAGSKNLPFAMAMLVNSWPLGIALGLMTQGPMTLAWGWHGAMLFSAGAALVATLLMFAFYKEAPNRTLPPASGLTALRSLSLNEWIGMFLIGTIWSFLNVGLAVVFGFAPALLTSQGHDLASAGQMVSLGTWVGIVAIPLGGIIAARSGQSKLVIFTCTSASVIVYALLAQYPASPILYVAFGVVGFAAAGPIMAQPSVLLTEENRAAGMGIFYTVYYVSMGLMPIVAGVLHDTNGPEAPLMFASVLMLISVICQIGLIRLPSIRLQSS
jgi:predicted MFS family arabinose efflux permease